LDGCRRDEYVMRGPEAVEKMSNNELADEAKANTTNASWSIAVGG
jgi:hypothetical protein